MAWALLGVALCTVGVAVTFFTEFHGYPITAMGLLCSMVSIVKGVREQ